MLGAPKNLRRCGMSPNDIRSDIRQNLAANEPQTRRTDANSTCAINLHAYNESMTTRKPLRPGSVGEPQVSPAQAIPILKTQVAKGEELLASEISGDKYSAWLLVVSNVLERAFGENSPNIRTVTEAGRLPMYPANAPETWWQKHRREVLANQLEKLRALVEVLGLDIPPAEELGSVRDTLVVSGQDTRRIFIVHGHDEKILHETARVLERLSQEVVVLRERPSRGHTIIEKFEEYGSSSAFAVVLLTADDEGRARDSEGLLRRARQNVIFELGYFVGKLGRQRVCVLREPEVEIPSDYSGVIYHDIDSKGHWRYALARELKDAGLNIDLNRMF